MVDSCKYYLNGIKMSVDHQKAQESHINETLSNALILVIQTRKARSLNPW